MQQGNAEFAHLSDEQLARSIESGWRDHLGRPSNSLALRLNRMEDELHDRQARAAREAFSKVSTRTPTDSLLDPVREVEDV